MSMTPRRTPVRRGLQLLLIAALAIQGCIPYTSDYLPDPRTMNTTTGLDRSAATAGPVRLSLIDRPSPAAPDTPLTVQLSQTLSGPEATITTFQEHRYQRHWAPLLIPVGVIIVPSAPLGLLGGMLAGDDKAFDMIFGSDPDPCRHSMFGFGLHAIVGIQTSCNVVESRSSEEKLPTGATVAKEVPLTGKPVEFRLNARGEAPVVRISSTDASGQAAFALQPHFLGYQDYPAEVEVTVRSLDEQEAAQTVRFNAETSRLLYRPIAEERAGDRARAEGKGLVALDHYTLACVGQGDPVMANPALWTKITATYRELPVKPFIPEASRRLSVQARTLAETNNPQGAIAKLNEAIQISPWLPSLRFDLAMTHAMNTDYHQAIASMRCYLELEPDAPDARLAQNKIYEWEVLTPSGTLPETGGSHTQPPANERGRQ